MYKAAIFDLDGTVADTLTGITHFVNRATAHFGLSSVSSEKIKYYVGDGAAVLIERVLSDVGGIEQKQQILEYYNALYNGDPYYKLKAFPGIPEMLDSLKQKGIKLAVLSNKPHTATAPICERLFHGRFDIVQGHVDGLPHKPDITGVMKICADLGVRPEECVYAGDTGVDMKTGKQAGMFTVGVLWGFRKQQELEQNGADRIVAHPKQLENIILQGEIK